MIPSTTADNQMNVTPDALALRLPLPPSINHQYATVNGRRVLSRAGRDYKRDVADAVDTWLARQACPEAITTRFQQHYLALHMLFYFATALRRDLDGGLKIAQDALCEALDVNDNLVVDITLKKRVDRHYPRMEVQLIALQHDEVDLYQDEGKTPPPPAPANPRPRRRRKRQQTRSLAELAARYKWD